MNCRGQHQQEVGVVDIPAAKAVLATLIEGFSTAVRAPLQQATAEQQQALASWVAEVKD